MLAVNMDMLTVIANNYYVLLNIVIALEIFIITFMMT